MQRMFAAALLAATMVGGAALVPSGASAATVPGPNAIPSRDAVRSVDPEVAAIELVRRGGGDGPRMTFGGGGGRNESRMAFGSPGVSSGGSRYSGGGPNLAWGGRVDGGSRVALGGRYLDGGRRVALGGRYLDGGRRVALGGRYLDGGRRVVLGGRHLDDGDRRRHGRRDDDDHFRFRRFRDRDVSFRLGFFGAPYYSSYPYLYDECFVRYREVWWNGRLVVRPVRVCPDYYPFRYGFGYRYW